MVTIRSRPNHTCRSTYKRAKQHCWPSLALQFHPPSRTRLTYRTIAHQVDLSTTRTLVTSIGERRLSHR
uniref:Uncharacterized protein n=2 Tax=Picea TaxID=3328 RepID=A0A117NJ08_PICGL|nr:hypothetical protein ABT39_MTgene627 [Picea glauca]QHR91673.1 hypothetical protein Q903MT_gene5709 [Picea sitchensis]